jgi:hypothetical protein
LQETYLPRRNAQFTVAPELETSAFVVADGMVIFHGPCQIGRYHAGGAFNGKAENDPREASPLRPGSARPPQPYLAL